MVLFICRLTVSPLYKPHPLIQPGGQCMGALAKRGPPWMPRAHHTPEVQEVVKKRLWEGKVSSVLAERDLSLQITF